MRRKLIIDFNVVKLMKYFLVLFDIRSNL